MTLLGVGHALVDAFAFTSEEVPKILGLHTGTFNTVPDYRMKAILMTLQNRTLMAGGSSANIVKLASQMGISSFFVSQCGNDNAGSQFESELQEAGVRTSLKRTDSPTGTCVTFLAPTGDRTIATFRSASAGLPPDLVSDALMQEADVVVLEGYLLDEPGFMESLLDRCRERGKRVAFDTSDMATVERHRERLLSFLKTGKIQFLFAQESEACSLAEAPAVEALKQLSPLVEVFVIKRGEHGCLLMQNGAVVQIPPAGTVAVDSTGAGDAFEAGFFWGLSRNLTPRMACNCGTKLAEVVMRQPGTKVDRDTMDALLKDLTARYPA